MEGLIYSITMKAKILILSLLLYPALLLANPFGFEDGVSPAVLTDNSSGILTIVSAPYKDGTHSLKWSWNKPSVLKIDYAVTNANYRDGVIFWVYNEVPHTKPLRCEYRDTNENAQYYFDFNLNFTGWRICRIGTKYMDGNKTVRTNLNLHLISPEGVDEGTLYIDRLSFVSDVNYQNAPDAQLPHNNETQYINHWNSLWKWENQEYNIPLPGVLSAEEQASLKKVEEGVNSIMIQSATNSTVNSAKTNFNSANIRYENGFIVGSPLVVADDAGTGDIDLSTLGTILYGLAQDAYFNHSEDSEEKFLLAWDYAQNQGFAYGSSMGNNHHYGYETREIFLAMFLMRDVLKSSGKLDQAVAALGYWSGLSETRVEFENTRDGVVDTWNTLLLARTISAVMISDKKERYRAVEALVRWVDGSLEPTPGNVGGLKPDGCIFHHAGHYPAYGIGGFGGLGKFFACINESDFQVSLNSRRNLADALLAMSIYSNTKDWSNGISGRHPLSGSISQEVINAYGYLTLSGGIYDESQPIDLHLGAEYLRLESGSSDLKTRITNAGASLGSLPQGFYVFNHTCLGVHRYEDAMVSIKGYNSDVWGSEIYTSDNRYGRYQSYGAIEIFNGGSPVSRSGSRFAESGWNWNRIPGTTTIHLPFDRLESPQTTTLMARSYEDFAGASTLNNEFGIFGMKLREQNDINNNNYTPDFTARKSVFVFGKRIICLGSNIYNTNNNYATETTLFQNTIRNTSSDKVILNNTSVTAYSINRNVYDENNITMVSDLLGNYYRLAPGTDLYVKGGLQQSRQNKTKAITEGNFTTAWINHGTAPADASYEYMIMLKPEDNEISEWTTDPQYEVLQQDNKAHIIKDKINNITGYVIFEDENPAQGKLIHSTHETLILTQEQNDGRLAVSVCDPSINLPDKVKNAETVIREGEPKTKRLIFKGTWLLEESNEFIEIHYLDNNTVIDITCILGLPVEFTLLDQNTGLPSAETDLIKIHQIDNQVFINGLTSNISVYTIDGRLLFSQKQEAQQRVIKLQKAQAYLLVAETPSKKKHHQIIIM